MRSLYALVVVGLLMGCGTGVPAAGPMPPGASFAGQWSSNWGFMKLMQNGTRIFGPLSGFRGGSVSGEQQGDLFVFRWTQQQPTLQYGRGYLRISADGQSLEGTWGYKKSYTDGGRWHATRTSD